MPDFCPKRRARRPLGSFTRTEEAEKSKSGPLEFGHFSPPSTRVPGKMPQAEFQASLAAAPSDSTAEKEVLAAMDAYKSAYLHGDGAAMAKLLSSNLSYINSDGTVQNKA
jgi:hypothetical protein